MYAVAEKSGRLPPFIHADDDFKVAIPPSRLIVWYPRGRRARLQGVIYVLELIDAANAPLTRTVGPVTLHYWWLNLAAGRDERRARKWAKWIFDDLGHPSRAGTLGQLVANNNVDHRRMKEGSPDLRRPISHDASGAPTAWDTYLQHEVFGRTLRADSDATSDTAINAETPDKPSQNLPSSISADPVRVRHVT